MNINWKFFFSWYWSRISCDAGKGFLRGKRKEAMEYVKQAKRKKTNLVNRLSRNVVIVCGTRKWVPRRDKVRLPSIMGTRTCQKPSVPPIMLPPRLTPSLISEKIVSCSRFHQPICTACLLLFILNADLPRNPQSRVACASLSGTYIQHCDQHAAGFSLGTSPPLFP